MIVDACSYQRGLIDEKLELHVESLVRGTASRDEDQRIRGLIQGLRMARDIVNDVEDRARRADSGDDSDD